MSGSPVQPEPISCQLMRRPALGAVISLMVGIMLYRHLPVLPVLWIAAAAALLVSARLNRHNGWLASASLALVLCLMGITLAQLHDYRYASDDIAQYTTDEPRLARVELRIEEPPRILSREFDPIRPLPPRQVFFASVQRVQLHDGWIDARGRIRVWVDPPHPALAAGQRIRALGMLQRPGPAMNPGQFDWARHDRNQRILTMLNIGNPAAITPLAPAKRSLLTDLRQSVRHALVRGFSNDQSLDHALLQALLLGDPDPELMDVRDQFQRTGTSHHLAISGLHIAVLGGFILLLCRLCSLPPRSSALLVSAFVLLYGLVALPSPPVVRSVLLCLSITFGILQRRSVDLIQLLALSALVMLIYRPLDLFNAGFQLSFGTVLGLILFTGPIMSILHQPDPFDVAPAAPTRLRALWNSLRMRGMQVLATALTAWLVSLPLVAYHFDRLNPWAMLASIVLAPVVFLALIGGLLKVVLTLLLPSLAGVWAMMAAWPVAGMRHLVDWLERLPGSDLPLIAPSPMFIVLYYLALGVPLLVPAMQQRLAPAARLLPVGLGLALLCLPAMR